MAWSCPSRSSKQVGQAVSVVVGNGDAHAGVRVGNALLRGDVAEAEAEAHRIRGRSSRPRQVPVELVRVGVVGHVHVETTITVQIREDRAEAVLRLADVDSGELPYLTEGRPAESILALVEVQEVAYASIGLREALEGVRDRTV